MQIYACYEGEKYDGTLSPFHPLNGDMDEAQLLSFLKELYDYNSDQDDTEVIENTADLVHRLIRREEQVVSGGLVIISNDFRLIPGCCCGLEGWVEWKDLQKGSYSPWLGHDPFPEVDTMGDKAILLNGLNVEPRKLEVSYSELSSLIEQASFNLSQFLERLRVWLNETGTDKESAEKLVHKMSEWFHITPLNLQTGKHA